MPAEARQYVGVPWLHQGRDPRHGLDCVGLVVRYVTARGYAVKDRKNYGRDPDGSLVHELCRLFGQPTNDPRPGDVVVMAYAAKLPRHVGILSEFNGQPHLIHADSRQGRVVEHPIDARWRKRIVGAWRVA